MSHRIIRQSKIVLMESAHLIRLKYTNGSVQHTTVVEEKEILFLPVVRPHKLNVVAHEQICVRKRDEKESTYTGRDGRTLHLV